MSKVSVTFMLWFDEASRRNPYYVYGTQNANLLKRQVARNLSIPHEFVLCCDERPDGLDDDIRTVPLDRRTFVPDTRFAKLMLFRPDIGGLIGERIFYLDLDTVITGNLDGIVGRREKMVLWRHPRWSLGKRKVTPYNSSVMLLNAGVRPDVWSEFPTGKTAEQMQKICPKEDQGWISRCVGPDAPHWGVGDGIYSGRLIKELPADARIVTFPGSREPGTAETQSQHPWIRRFRH